MSTVPGNTGRSMTGVRVTGTLGLVLLIALAYHLVNSSDTPVQNQTAATATDRDSGETFTVADPLAPASTPLASDGDSVDDAVTRDNRVASDIRRRITDSLQPSPDRSSELLSAEVYRVISEVQKLFTDDRIPEGLAKLNALYYEKFDGLSSFEQATVLNFYTNALLAYRMLPEATAAFEKILTVDNVREDIRLRALKSLGQLSAAQDEFADAVAYLNQFLEDSGQQDATALLALSNAYENLGQLDYAIPKLLEYARVQTDGGNALSESVIRKLRAFATTAVDPALKQQLDEFLTVRINPPKN